MDYERKYKEVLEKARQLCAYPTTKPFISDLQDIFPELKESEDEQIRKRIIQSLHGDVLDMEETNKAIAWLEKQGEQKPVEWCSEDEQNLNVCLSYIPHEFLRRWLKDIIHIKYDKPIDMVEPKFHKGEWITIKE